VTAFGWEAVQVEGHDSKAIFEAVIDRQGVKPTILVCRTVKGKGVSYMEHVPLWHYRSPNVEEYKQALAEIESAA
jgi:transketolase